MFKQLVMQSAGYFSLHKVTRETGECSALWHKDKNNAEKIIWLLCCGLQCLPLSSVLIRFLKAMNKNRASTCHDDK